MTATITPSKGGKNTGRPPTTLSDSQCQEVETLAAVLSMEQVADYFGISRVTFYAIMERQPNVSLHYKRGKSKAISNVANGLLQKALDGDTASSIFYLKTQAGWRETKEEVKDDEIIATSVKVTVQDASKRSS